jgi:ubiquitin carboxyl-terminal hydrolase 48
VYEDRPLEEEELAIIPLEFRRAWLSWLNNPTEYARPDSVDNSAFFCEHHQLVLDPNCPLDMKMIVSIIHRTDWDVLETL